MACDPGRSEGSSEGVRAAMASADAAAEALAASEQEKMELKEEVRLAKEEAQNRLQLCAITGRELDRSEAEVEFLKKKIQKMVAVHHRSSGGQELQEHAEDGRDLSVLVEALGAELGWYRERVTVLEAELLRAGGQEEDIDLQAVMQFLQDTQDVSGEAELSFHEVLPAMLNAGFSEKQCAAIIREILSGGEPDDVTGGSGDRAELGGGVTELAGGSTSRVRVEVGQTEWEEGRAEAPAGGAVGAGEEAQRLAVENSTLASRCLELREQVTIAPGVSVSVRNTDLLCVVELITSGRRTAVWA